MTKTKKYEEGSRKIKISDNNKYIFQNNEWKYTDAISSEIKKIIDLYATKENISLLIDKITGKFIKGHIDKHKKISGARIKHLPSGKELARGGFSIFAKNLAINKNKKLLWDICYENTSGLKTYLYSTDKVELERKKKSKTVDKFTLEHKNILKNVENDLQKTKETKYLALLTLLKTHMRVGNLHHYNNLKHKGLTTLQKKDIKINKKTNQCTFSFIGKDGVPQEITKKFPAYYIETLNKKLKTLKKDEFVFTSKKTSKPIHSSTFSNILFSYTNKHFYPHIIRSFYADLTCKNFITNNKNKKISKKEVETCFLEIAANLGHKKFNKKNNQWEINFKVTIENYIRPEYVEKMKSLYNNKNTNNK